MAAATGRLVRARRASVRPVRHPGWLDAAAAVAGLAFVAGLFLDGWAHTHLAELETFFTPWHAVLYSGFAALAAVTVAPIALARRRGVPWKSAVPEGYGLGLLGVGLFAAGGVGDGIWHVLFGVEANVEALLSPTHLLLAAGISLLVTSPLRSAWRRLDDAPGFVALLPAIVAAGSFLAVLGFFTQIYHPFVRPWAGAGNAPVADVFLLASATPPIPGIPGGMLATDVAQIAGLGAIVLQAAVLAGFVVTLAGRWSLPLGTFAIAFGIAGILLGLMRDQWFAIPVAILGGLAADGIVRARRAIVDERWQTRVVAASVPASTFALYFVALTLAGGVWWSTHLWAGAIVVAGLAGLLVGLVAAPPERP